MVSITVSLDIELLLEIDRIAEKQRKSRSAVINELLKKALESDEK